MPGVMPRVAELLIRELTMRGAGGMQHAGADIRHMHLQGYELERIDETGSRRRGRP